LVVIVVVGVMTLNQRVENTLSWCLKLRDDKALKHAAIRFCFPGWQRLTGLSGFVNSFRNELETLFELRVDKRFPLKG